MQMRPTYCLSMSQWVQLRVDGATMYVQLHIFKQA